MDISRFQALVAELREFMAGDPSFPIMSLIGELIDHAEELREVVEELSVGLDDFQLQDMVDDVLG